MSEETSRICSGRGFIHWRSRWHVYPVAAISFGQALTLPSFSTMVDLAFILPLPPRGHTHGPRQRVRWLPLSARQQRGGMGMVASRWQ